MTFNMIEESEVKKKMYLIGSVALVIGLLIGGTVGWRMHDGKLHDSLVELNNICLEENLVLGIWVDAQDTLLADCFAPGDLDKSSPLTEVDT